MTQQNEQTAMMVERDDAIEDAVVALLNVAVVPASSGDDHECTLCGAGEDNHTVTCPVPALEEWVNPD